MAGFLYFGCMREEIARIVRDLIVRYGISSPFGPRTLAQYGYHLHAGIDIPIPMRTPIRFPFPVSIAPAGGYGYAAMIRDGDYLFIFAHLTPQQPDPYTILTGNTGRSTGAHLHFEVRVAGKPVDPLVWLRQQEGAPLTTLAAVMAVALLAVAAMRPAWLRLA